MPPITACAALATLLLLAGPARAWISPAPDVVVDCTPSLAPVLQHLADAWRARTQVAVHLYTGPPARLIGLVRHRARADLIVAEQQVLTTLRTDHLLSDDAAVSLGTDPFVLAGEAPPPPGPASPADLVARLPAIVTDPTTAAGFDGQALLRRIATGPLPAPPIGLPTTDAVVQRAAATPGRIALVRGSDAAGQPRLHVLARIPEALAPPVPIGAALTRNGQSGRTTAFLAFIASPAAQPLWHRAGLDLPR